MGGGGTNDSGPGTGRSHSFSAHRDDRGMKGGQGPNGGLFIEPNAPPGPGSGPDTAREHASTGADRSLAQKKSRNGRLVFVRTGPSCEERTPRAPAPNPSPT